MIFCLLDARFDAYVQAILGHWWLVPRYSCVSFQFIGSHCYVIWCVLCVVKRVVVTFMWLVSYITNPNALLAKLCHKTLLSYHTLGWHPLDWYQMFGHKANCRGVVHNLLNARRDDFRNVIHRHNCSIDHRIGPKYCTLTCIFLYSAAGQIPHV